LKKREKMGDILKNDKVSIPYFETPCKIGRKFSFDIVSSTSIIRISLGFFYALEEAIQELEFFSRGKPLGNQKERVAYFQRFVKGKNGTK
jgi:hypothetical protein